MIAIQIDGREFSASAVRAWEKRRLAWSARYLKRRLGSTQEIVTNQDLLDFKINTQEADMRRALRTHLTISSFLAAAMTRLSRGKRKLCITEFVIQGCSAERLYKGFTAMMLDNAPENQRHCLAACPDHYLLRGCGEGMQEVIEVAGSMPLPLQFFVTYGDESGLMTRKESGYSFQAAGVARLANGLAMGGVRHQMRDIEGGCAVRLTVEFPALMPGRTIREHQLHLACEFYHWFAVLLTD